MNNFIAMINKIITKFNLNLTWYNSIETTSFIKFNMFTPGTINDILKYENEFISVLGDNIWLEGKNGFIGICIPKSNKDTYSINEILESDFYNSYSGTLKIALGETVNGEMVIGDLEEFIHILIAGVTRSGKSNLLNVIINCLIQNDSSILNMVLFDLKLVELTKYKNIPHLVKPIITSEIEAIKCLEFIINEMNDRYKKIEKANVRNISSYNRKYGLIPYLVVIIDELSKLMIECKEKVKIESMLILIASLGGACGIHLIIATQKPSSNIITTDIKSNIDTRISFKVTNHYDSMVILDETGAQNLRMGGDMLLRDRDGLTRLQCCYLSDEEIEDNLYKYNLPFGSVSVPSEVLELECKEVEFVEVGIKTEKEKPLSEFDRLYLKALEFVKDTKEVNQWKLRNLLNKGPKFCDSIIDKMICENVITDFKIGNVYKLRGDN